MEVSAIEKEIGKKGMGAKGFIRYTAAENRLVFMQNMIIKICRKLKISTFKHVRKLLVRKF